MKRAAKRAAGWQFAVALIVGILFNGATRTPLASAQNATAPNADISGSWVAKVTSPMGPLEISYRLKVVDGKISGIQTLPFGDSIIIDGQVTGDTFHFTVAIDRFGIVQNRDVNGKIVGDTLVLTPGVPCAAAGISRRSAGRRRRRGWSSSECASGLSGRRDDFPARHPNALLPRTHRGLCHLAQGRSSRGLP
jgi:hypothetical protein